MISKAWLAFPRIVEFITLGKIDYVITEQLLDLLEFPPLKRVEFMK